MNTFFFIRSALENCESILTKVLVRNKFSINLRHLPRKIFLIEIKRLTHSSLLLKPYFLSLIMFFFLWRNNTNNLYLFN